MGKPAGSDRAHGKATYPALFGIDAARAHAQQAMEDALAALQPFDQRADPLRWLAIYAIERTA
jgi:geranylgeranyl diphosphate synthase type II